MEEVYFQMKLFMVVVHMPHKNIVCPFQKRTDAYQYFCKLLKEASQRYGHRDINGASIEHCLRFGFFEIKHGFFIQLYEADINSEEKIEWPDITAWR